MPVRLQIRRCNIVNLNQLSSYESSNSFESMHRQVRNRSIGLCIGASTGGTGGQDPPDFWTEGVKGGPFWPSSLAETTFLDKKNAPKIHIHQSKISIKCPGRTPGPPDTRHRCIHRPTGSRP